MDNINRKFVMIIFISLIVLLFAVNVNSETAWKWNKGGAFENHDIPGKDYKSFEVRNDYFPVCMDACAKDTKCKGYTFVRPSPEGGVGRCYLKYGVEGYVYKPGRISDYKIYYFSCDQLSFVTKSPIPAAVLGGHYSYQINTSGGIKPIEFCPMQKDPRGTPPRCDNSPEQNFSMPLGVKLSKTGLISGQVKCPDSDPSKCEEAYIPILVQASDSCPNSPQRIMGEFWIHIRNPMALRN